MSVVKWPEIFHFHHVRKAAEGWPEILSGRTTVGYRAKLKLHGTNGGIQIRENAVKAQSREAMLGPGADNRGFARWVGTQESAFRANFPCPTGCIWGEWCGPGVQRGTAVNQVGSKFFAVFAASYGLDTETLTLVTDPAELAALVAGIPDAHVLPWWGSTVDVPWLADVADLQPIVDGINEDVLSIETEDPWVKETFGVAGVGEGLVFYPQSHRTFRHFTDLAFKAKGQKHKVLATKVPAQVDPEVVESAGKFAELVLTPARLEQAAMKASGDPIQYEKRLIGPFLKYLLDDVVKETADELAASRLTWKEVQSVVSAGARQWYLDKAR